jgi:hypothetical protein
MKKSTLILVGVGVLALVGVGIFVMRRRGQAPASAAPAAAGAAPAPTTAGQVISDVGGKLAETIKSDPLKYELRRETAAQRLENRRLKKATRQAKLIKKGKIDPRDLQTLQSIQAFAGGDSFFD